MSVSVCWRMYLGLCACWEWGDCVCQCVGVGFDVSVGLCARGQGGARGAGQEVVCTRQPPRFSP